MQTTAMARAYAHIDFTRGCTLDDSPFPKDSPNDLAWRDELQKLIDHETEVDIRKDTSRLSHIA